MPSPDNFPHDDSRHAADPAWAKLSPEEFEMVEEDVSGRPADHGSAAANLQNLRRRLQRLNEIKVKTLNAYRTRVSSSGYLHPLTDPTLHDRDLTLISLDADLNKMTADIAATEERIKHYEHQLQAGN